MATKQSAQSRSSAKPKRSRPAEPPPSDTQNLFQTDVSGVFRNKAGHLVDERGILLALSSAVDTEEAAAIRVLGGPVTTPAEYLKRIALDPFLPTGLRVDAAKAAAPYYDKKVAVDTNLNTTNTAFDPVKLAAMKREDRESLLKLLRAAGASV